MQKGDIVRHYSCGGMLQLGIVEDIYECECAVWYPNGNYRITNFINEFDVISSWENLQLKVQGNFQYTDDLLDGNILK